ncbi:MAG: ABC transporter substrate-binding protein, partial [Spirochaetota bacterium]
MLPVRLFATGTIEMEPTRVVTDALDRRVEVPESPERIVAAGSAVLMIADALYLFPGADERIVGLGRINQGKGNFLAAIDDEYGEKAVLERNVGPEQIAGLNPDLVILKSFMRGRLGVGVERLGVPVVYVDLETPEQYQRDLRLFGEVLGQPERGR